MSSNSGAPPPPVDAKDSFFARLNKQLPVPLSSHTLVHLLAGASARMSGAVISSPLDTVKVRLQFQSKVSSDVTHYRGIGHAFAKIYVREGIAGFYKGLPVRAMYIGPAAAISFVFYEQFRTMYHRPKQSSSQYLGVLLPLAAGGIARVIGTISRTPFDVLKERLQVQGSLKSSSTIKSDGVTKLRGKYSGVFDAIRTITRTEGVFALWSGVGATILRDVPFAAIYFFSYETLKSGQVYLYKQAGKVPKDSTLRDGGLKSYNFLLSGAGAAAIAVMLTNPLDVVKTRLQTQGSLDPSQRRYTGIANCFMTIARTEGWAGLYRGLLPRLLYLCPSAAITFTLYEFYKSQLERVLGGSDECPAPSPAGERHASGGSGGGGMM